MDTPHAFHIYILMLLFVEWWWRERIHPSLLKHFWKNFKNKQLKLSVICTLTRKIFLKSSTVLRTVCSLGHLIILLNNFFGGGIYS